MQLLPGQAYSSSVRKSNTMKVYQLEQNDQEFLYSAHSQIEAEFSSNIIQFVLESDEF